MILPKTLTRDLSRFDSCEFKDIPRWVIMRNDAGLQVQLFWEAREAKSEATEQKQNSPKRSKRKRSPHKIEKIEEDQFTKRHSDDLEQNLENMNSMELSAELLSQLNKWKDEVGTSTNNNARHLSSLVNLDRSPPDSSTRLRSRRSPAPRFYPLTDPVVQFLQETLIEDSQGRVACSDLSELSAHKFGNPINMVSMGMKLRFLYPTVTRVKINNRAFYTNVAVRTENLSASTSKNFSS